MVSKTSWMEFEKKEDEEEKDMRRKRRRRGCWQGKSRDMERTIMEKDGLWLMDGLEKDNKEERG